MLVTFEQQTEYFMNHLETRKRRPIKPATAKSWKNTVKIWLNPNIGTLPLSEVNNLALKQLVSKMADAKLAAKSITNYLQIVKMVVASAINEQGEPLYPRKWNHEFMDLPEIRKQNTPMPTSVDVTKIVARAEGQYKVLFALLAGSGLRIGEATGLEIQDVSADGFTLNIHQSVWNGKVQTPKTFNAFREVDLCPTLAQIIKDHIGGRLAGFLFHTSSGKPLNPNNVMNRYLHPIQASIGREKSGFHSFRRFRVTHLRRNGVQEDVLRFWIGHADRNVTDGYSRVKEDLAFRQTLANTVGLGFDVNA